MTTGKLLSCLYNKGGLYPQGLFNYYSTSRYGHLALHNKFLLTLRQLDLIEILMRHFMKGSTNDNR